MDKNSRSYFKREFAGKSAVGVWLDRALVSVAAVALSYTWFLRRVKSYAAALLLSLILACAAAVVIALIQRIRFDRFVKKRTAELKKQALLLHMTMLTQSEAMDMLIKSDESLLDIEAVDVLECGFTAQKGNTRRLCAVFLRHPEEPVAASEVLKAYREARRRACAKLHLYSTAPMSEQAKTTADNLDIELRVFTQDRMIELCDRAGLLPTDEYVDTAIRAKITDRRAVRSAVAKNALSRSAARRYLTAGAAIMVASYITGSTLYYPIMAGLCFALSAVSYATGSKSGETTGRTDTSAGR